MVFQGGDWAGNSYSGSGCPSDCNTYVNTNPSAFQFAYWDIASVRVYEPYVMRVSPLHAAALTDVGSSAARLVARLVARTRFTRTATLASVSMFRVVCWPTALPCRCTFASSPQ